MGSWFGGSDQSGFSTLEANGGASSTLLSILMCDNIQPGSDPSYQICKEIFVSHPLGAKIAATPIKRAQSQKRIINIAAGPEELLREQFLNTFESMQVDRIIRNGHTIARIYGISVIAAIGEGEPETPLDMTRLEDITFNVFDPLNVSGSLTLSQDPNDKDFLKPKYVVAAGQRYHPSRVIVLMNEEPIYIQWSPSAYGYVGRSIYQRSLYPLQSFIQSMFTDAQVTQKAGLLIAMIKQAGNISNKLMSAAAGWKRSALKMGGTGNVLSIGNEDRIESLDMQNLEGPARFARDNILKNCAVSCDMPASMLNEETLTEGFGEGSEDAKIIASYIGGLRLEMGPTYEFMDRIVMRRAWTEEFYESLQRQFPEYKRVKFETAFVEFSKGFKASWPNLLTEPDSEKAKNEKVKFEAATSLGQLLMPSLDPLNKATLIMWLAEQANESKELFSTPLEFDQVELENFVPTVPDLKEDAEEPGGSQFAGR